MFVCDNFYFYSLTKMAQFLFLQQRFYMKINIDYRYKYSLISFQEHSLFESQFKADFPAGSSQKQKWEAVTANKQPELRPVRTTAITRHRHGNGVGGDLFQPSVCGQ